MCVMDAGSVESGDRTNGPGSHIALRVPNGQIVGFLLARLCRKHEPPSVCFYKRVASLPTTAPEQQRVRQAADAEVSAIGVLADLWFSFAGQPLISVGSKGYRGVITTGVSVRTYVGGANA
jgi:hypothetical protein